MTETDKAIQRKFDFRRRNRNLPWYPRLGGSDVTRNALAVLFGEIGFSTGAEIGTRTGEFAQVLCRANPQLTLFCVDPWEAYPAVISQERQDRRYAAAVRALSPHDARIVRKRSLDAVDDFDDGSLDFAYIDGDHLFDMAIQDIIRWAPKVRPGGIIAVHDYHPFTGSDVIWAVNAYTHCHGIDPWYVTREREPTAFWVQR